MNKYQKIIDDASLPDLLVDASNLPATAKNLAELFVADGRFLSNGHAVVTVIADHKMPRAIEVTGDIVRSCAHEVCRPVKMAEKELKATTLSRDVANLYLLGLEGRWGLPPLHGITTTPILSNDAGIRVAHGYDKVSGLWAHDIPNVAVAQRPTKSEAAAALLRLRKFFRTFPFANGERVVVDDIDVVDVSEPPGLDESTFLVALLTAVTRASLELASAFLCDAPNLSGAGTGKGLLVKAAVIIASGQRPAAFSAGHDKEEFDKRLTSALVAACPAVFLDNYNGKDLMSDILASVLTESPAMTRLMGQTKIVPLHTRCFIGITGNSVRIAEDMARRVLKTSLDARMENPEQRKFKPGFLDSVFENRAPLLSDALTIWRWGRQNEIESGLPLGSYEVWAQWCRDPLLALDCKDPVLGVAKNKAADPRREALIEVLEAWWKCHGNQIVQSGDLVDEVVALMDPNSKRRADGAPLPSRQFIARFCKAHAETHAGGYVLHQIADETHTRPRYSYQLAQSTKRKPACE